MIFHFKQLTTKPNWLQIVVGWVKNYKKMNTKTFKVKEKCPNCKGTGIYTGMGERDGAGVVCYNCKGTGCYVFEHHYEEFTKRKNRNDIKRVYEYNPGIVIGEGNNCTLEGFGGQSYKDWEKGKAFSDGSEMRKYVCPAWWYQSVNYKLKPNWKDCGLGSFSKCENFNTKEKCWIRFDKEQQSK
ncbi:MAG: hypothetical protein OEY89_01450 [Gammaproteobacteria bacterium]|nr:hypothetical protein [Gammaproteobacteria bacterium]